MKHIGTASSAVAFCTAFGQLVSHMNVGAFVAFLVVAGVLLLKGSSATTAS